MTAKDNLARPVSGARLVRLDDLPDPSARALDFRAGDQLYSLIFARRGDAVRAFENVCPHAGLPLERPDGRVPFSEGHIICAMHGATFAFETGACAGGPASRGLKPVPIVLADGWAVMA